MKQRIEPVLTPAHPNAFEPLNNQPLTGTFDHATPDGQPHRFILMILDVIVMRVEITQQIAQDFS